MQPWLLTKEMNVHTSLTSQAESTTKTTSIQTEATPVKKYPQTIKIREILPTSSLIGNPVYQSDAIPEIPSLEVSITTSSPTSESHETIVDNEAGVMPLQTSITENVVTNKDNLLANATIKKLANSGKSDQLITVNPLELNSTSQATSTESNSFNSNEEFQSNLEPEMNLITTDCYEGVTFTEEGQLMADSEKLNETNSELRTKENVQDISNQTSNSKKDNVNDAISNENKFLYTTPGSDSIQLNISHYSTEPDSDDLISTTLPPFDLIVDIHNSTDRVKITLPTEEPFSTIYPNKYDFDSEASEIDYQGSSSTELLGGGVYTSSEVNSNEGHDIESTSESLTELSGDGSVMEESSEHSNSNTTRESHYGNGTSPSITGNYNVHNKSNNFHNDSEESSGDNQSSNSIEDLTESYRTSTNSGPITSDTSLKQHEISTTMSTLFFSNSDESKEGTDEVTFGVENNQNKKRKPIHHSSESSFSESSSSEENESTDEASVRSDEFSLPPILQLNEQIQYLKIGGHHEDEQTQPLIHVDIFNIHSKPLSCNSSSHKGNNIAKETHTNIELKMTENVKNSQSGVKVSHVLLTPNDLKTLAEYLMSEKAKSTINRPKIPYENSDVTRNENNEVTSFVPTTDQGYTSDIADDLNNFTPNPLENSDLRFNHSGEKKKGILSGVTTQNSILPESSGISGSSSEEIINTTPAVLEEIEFITPQNNKFINETDVSINANSSEYDSEEFPSHEITEGYRSSVTEVNESSLEIEELNSTRELLLDNLESPLHDNKNVSAFNNSKPEKYIDDKEKMGVSFNEHKQENTTEEELSIDSTTHMSHQQEEKYNDEYSSKSKVPIKEFVTEQFSKPVDSGLSLLRNVKRLTSP
ncbi:hypothetical protein AAG570_000401 [Ranatra chinensis]|uniref:Uncharacterized protein n=1 Tax=Ranatra chinensis TaxID=642074 RepID=A0ABD0YX00_9HEMI